MKWAKFISMASVIVGLGLISFGLWQFDPRLGIMLAGLGLVLLGIGVI